MYEPSDKELEAIEEIVREQEHSLLVSIMLNSKDENVLSLLEEALMVAKMVHGEELGDSLNSHRKQLINEKIKRHIDSEIVIEQMRAHLEK